MRALAGGIAVMIAFRAGRTVPGRPLLCRRRRLSLPGPGLSVEMGRSLPTGVRLLDIRGPMAVPPRALIEQPGSAQTHKKED